VVFHDCWFSGVTFPRKNGSIQAGNKVFEAENTLLPVEYVKKRQLLTMKILIFHVGSLGDTLVSALALHMICENFPEAKLTLLSNNQAKK